MLFIIPSIESNDRVAHCKLRYVIRLHYDTKCVIIRDGSVFTVFRSNSKQNFSVS